MVVGRDDGCVEVAEVGAAVLTDVGDSVGRTDGVLVGATDTKVGTGCTVVGRAVGD